MKYLSLFLTFIVFNLFAQKVDTFQINSIPTEGVLLDKGWKFQVGDNLDFAKVDFDDSQWDTVSLSNYQQYQPFLKKTPIAWFRIQLSLSSLAAEKQIALSISQLGASEIYVNGSLFKKLGEISLSKNIINNNPHDKPLLLPVHTKDMVIAIRFASQVSNRIWLLKNKSPLSIRISDWENALNTHIKSLKEIRFFLCLWVLFWGIGLLFFLLYAFYLKENTHFYFACFCLFYGILLILLIHQSEASVDVETAGLESFLFDTTNKICGVFMLCVLTSALNNRISFYQKVLIFALIVVLTPLAYVFPPNPILNFLGVFHRSLFMIELFRLGLVGFKQKNYQMGLAGWTSGMLNFFFILLALTGIDFTNIYTPIAGIIIFILFTVYLANRFARNNLNLVIQLTENTKLAAANLQKELEKQQILSSQNETLEKKVEERTAELKASQNQLIQKEKLASLGELTAGIAHEIQNPLNFVNNFSELSVDLIKEIQDERQKRYAAAGREARDEALENELLADLSSNQEKINHHGKRASSIVKGMLEHSRTSTGERVLTDINQLADEYLRLSYHGMRAKNSKFNSDFTT